MGKGGGGRRRWEHPPPPPPLTLSDPRAAPNGSGRRYRAGTGKKHTQVELMTGKNTIPDGRRCPGEPPATPCTTNLNRLALSRRTVVSPVPVGTLGRGKEGRALKKEEEEERRALPYFPRLHRHWGTTCRTSGQHLLFERWEEEVKDTPTNVPQQNRGFLAPKW